MSMQDPLSDMLTRIRNAQLARKPKTLMPSSKLKISMAKILMDEGYISGYQVIDASKNKPVLEVALKYHQGKPVIEKIESISTPGLRHYAKADALPKVRGGLGVAIVSTSQGLMTDRAARKVGLGGQILCTVF